MKTFILKQLGAIVSDWKSQTALLAGLLSSLYTQTWIIVAIVFLGSYLFLKFCEQIWKKCLTWRYRRSKKREVWETYKNLNKHEKRVIDEMFNANVQCNEFTDDRTVRSLLSNGLLLPASNQPPKIISLGEMSLQLRINPDLWSRLQDNS